MEPYRRIKIVNGSMLYPDTFEVRANWDIDVGQISMEEK
ncbi:MAG: hypothetical protein Ct9H90mP7_1570 [Candidatus Neomarinimicrobiota bacterium]|nr:MAG: hypothetical protein Ct9H90mP7_1570 [Candidatus Neomarinimicrobiota bacterium]